MRILLYAAIAVLVVYIGAEPLVAKASHVAALVMNYVCDALVIASMFMLLMYYSKYGKVDGYLSRIEDELADAGYYLSDRPEREIQPLTAAVLADLDRYGYTVERDLELCDMPFDARAMKKKRILLCGGDGSADPGRYFGLFRCGIYRSDGTEDEAQRQRRDLVCNGHGRGRRH